MLTINVATMTADSARRKLEEFDKQAKFAAVVAANRAAFAARIAIQREMGRVFRNVTPWVKGGVRVRKATQRDPIAIVDLDFWGNKQGVSVEDVLRAEINGGERKYKRHELALQRAGILPAGMFIAPGPGAKRDSYGNMSAGQIVQIISFFNAFGEQGYQANMSANRRARLAKGNRRSGNRGFVYFALKERKGSLPPGIYQRISFGGMGSAVKLIMVFVRRPKYQRRLDFYGVGESAARAEFAVQFPAALSDARRSAR